MTDNNTVVLGERLNPTLSEMFARLYHSTPSHALTGTSYTFQLDAEVSNPNPFIRVCGDVNFHIRTDGGDATTSDTPVERGLIGINLRVQPGGKISVIKQAGGDDGTVWFSHAKIY
jgi:hypothetical protein